MGYPGSDLKIVCTIEARMNASRLPGKMMLPLAGKPVIERVIDRIRPSKYVDEIIVASTEHPLDDLLEYACKLSKCLCYRGSEEDVMSRVLEAAETVDGDLIVEINGDCPMIDPRHIDQVIAAFFSGEFDYASNLTALGSGFPDGMDVQVFPVSILREVSGYITDPVARSHVSYPIYSQPERYRCVTCHAEGDLVWPELELLLDEKDDYILLDTLYRRLTENSSAFTAEDVVRYLRQHQDLLTITNQVKRKALEEG